jgi:hypothetical protein
MNEILLNHIKAYYHGVKHFKCPLLRGELGNKINIFKQRMKKHNQYPKKNYLEQDLSDEDNNTNSTKFKRKRSEEDDEKENDRYHRKVVIKSTVIKNEQRTVIVKESIDESEKKRQKLIDNPMIKFNHEYCDIMYDNEFEGLHLLHFSSYDMESFEGIDDLQLENNFIQIKHKEKTDIKPFENMITSSK